MICDFEHVSPDIVQVYCPFTVIKQNQISIWPLDFCKKLNDVSHIKKSVIIICWGGLV